MNQCNLLQKEEENVHRERQRDKLIFSQQVENHKRLMNR